MRDFIIIGGGIAGISAAAELSKIGTVTVLEAEGALAHHASGRSAALYEPHYGLPPIVALSLASGDELRAKDGILSPRGMMVLAGAHERAAFEKERKGFNLDDLTIEEARARFPILNPDRVAYAAAADHAWDIDTDLLIQGYLKEARARGAEVLPKARAAAIDRLPGGWHVATAQGDHEGRILVNASGAWVDEVAKLAGMAPLGFTPMRRSMARIPAPGGLDPAHWPMVFGVGESWYCKPDAGALIVSPAEEHPADPHDAWADDMVLAEGLARFEEKVTEPVTRLIASWAGLRTFSPDRVPVIGFAPSDPGFFWLAGQGGYGFQSAPGVSRLVGDLVAGRAPAIGADVVAAVTPARFQ
jgi:D-arginine dehydrogenase